MRRTILLIIILIVLVAVVLGIYFIVSNSNSSPKGVVSTAVSNNYFNNGPADFKALGMKVEILTRGTGNDVKLGDTVTVNYVGKLQDGKVFDSTYDRKKTLSFTVGKDNIIKGWDLGVLGMKVGEKRRLTIPPESAYGQSGLGSVIPPNASLIFEIDLLKINQ